MATGISLEESVRNLLENFNVVYHVKFRLWSHLLSLCTDCVKQLLIARGFRVFHHLSHHVKLASRLHFKLFLFPRIPYGDSPTSPLPSPIHSPVINHFPHTLQVRIFYFFSQFDVYFQQIVHLYLTNARSIVTFYDPSTFSGKSVVIYCVKKILHVNIFVSSFSTIHYTNRWICNLVHSRYALIRWWPMTTQCVRLCLSLIWDNRAQRQNCIIFSQGNKTGSVISSFGVVSIIICKICLNSISAHMRSQLKNNTYMTCRIFYILLQNARF